MIEPYDSGEYLLFGKQAPQCNSNQANQTIRRYISYLFQNFALLEDETIEKNLEIALIYSRISKKEKSSELCYSQKGLNTEEVRKEE